VYAELGIGLRELVVKPGQLDNFRAPTAEMVESTRSEPDVLVYERFISDDGKDVHVYERYTDSESAVAHLHAFGEKFGRRFVGMIDRRLLTVYGTPSGELKRMLDAFGATYLRHFGGFSQVA